MLQNTGIVLSEVGVPLLKPVNEDDIGMVEAMDSNKKLQIKCLWYIFVQSVVKNKTSRLVMQNMFQCELQ